MTAPDELLFCKFDNFSLLQSQETELNSEVNSYPSNALLNTSEQDICAYFVQKYTIAVPELREDEITVTQEEEQVDVSGDPQRFISNRNRPFYIPGTKITFEVPFSGNGQLFQCRPSSFDLNPPRALVNQDYLRFTYLDVSHNAQGVRAAFDRNISSVRSYLATLRKDAETFNTSLDSRVRQRLAARRTKLLNDQGMVSALGFPLKQRDNAPRTYAVPDVRRKPPIQRPTVTTAPFRPEPTLPDAEYENILRIISGMALVLERSPAAFAGMGEEDLRQHFLVQLNGQYEGQATGETFNAEGKTDILIRAEGANVFIAECKFWKGAQAFTETITQLLGYVTWRDTKTALIIFNRNKDLSAVLDTIGETALKHPNYKRILTTGSETAFRYMFHSPTDINREVAVAVLVFDVPTK